MKTVYIVLTRTNTALSRLIRLIKGDTYTHAALSLDHDLDYMFSFGRRYGNNPILGCFKRERLNEGLYKFQPRLPGVVLGLRVTDDQYDRVRELITEFLLDSHLYEYNYTGLLVNFLSLYKPLPTSDGLENNYRFVCSEFVYYVLFTCGILNLNLPKNLVRPQDFLNIGAEIVYEGDLKQFARENAGTRIRLTLSPVC